MKNIFLILSLSIIALAVQSQDTIVFKDGRKLACNIIDSDSTNIYFEVVKNGQKIRTRYSKANIEDICKDLRINYQFQKK